MFDGGCSTPASGLTYSWDFGDGRPVKSGGPTITDSYARSGRYTLSLTVSSGATTSTPATAPVRVHIDCAQPAPNSNPYISVDPNRGCMISGDGGATFQVHIDSGTVSFQNSDFRLEGSAFDFVSNECPGASGGSGLFPGLKCDVKVRGTCTEGSLGRLAIGGSLSGGGRVPNYIINLTCNP